MASHQLDTSSSALGHWLPRGVAVFLGLGFVALGLWAMVAPHAFFDALATFEPYNQHFLQDTDIPTFGAMTILLLAAGEVRWRHARGAAR